MLFITRKYDKNGKVIEETVENFVLDKNKRGGGTLDKVKFENIDLAEKILGKYDQIDELAPIPQEVWDNLLGIEANCNYAYGYCFTCGGEIESKFYLYRSQRRYRTRCIDCDAGALVDWRGEEG